VSGSNIREIGFGGASLIRGVRGGNSEGVFYDRLFSCLGGGGEVYISIGKGSRLFWERVRDYKMRNQTLGEDRPIQDKEWEISKAKLENGNCAQSFRRKGKIFSKSHSSLKKLEKANSS